MFEQSVVEVRALAARPWTMAVSLAGQGILISAVVLLPLMHPQTLERVAAWIPVTGPPREYRPPAPTAAQPVRTVAARRVLDAHTLFQPPAVPARIAMLQEEPAAVAGADTGPCAGCVVGGVGGPGPVSPVIAGLATPIALPPPPPAVKPVPPKEPPPRPSPVIRGGDVQAALLIRAPQPVYPPLARAARISGIVHLAALIGADGRMLDLRATSGHPLLAHAALEAVKQWVYRPTLLNGIPVEVVTEITVTFKLD